MPKINDDLSDLEKYTLIAAVAFAQAYADYALDQMPCEIGDQAMYTLVSSWNRPEMLEMWIAARDAAKAILIKEEFGAKFVGMWFHAGKSN